MDIEKKVIEIAANAYQVSEADIHLQTDIREEISNQSIKLIGFVGALEEEFGIMIEFQEAGALKTIEDFVNKVKELA